MPFNFVPEREKIWQQTHETILSGKFPDEELLLAIYRFQYNYNTIYRQYCEQTGRRPSSVIRKDDIPFLPITAFKHQVVKTGEFDEEVVFTSSGTSQSGQSKHFVKNTSFYLDNCTRIWQNHFGQPGKFCFLALLPGYLEREGSSLITMTNHFISLSEYKQSGFYLRNHEELRKQLVYCKKNNIPTVLLGVSYALLDFIDSHSLSFPTLVVMETGGMKGQREEISKTELHAILKKGFGTEVIYSEYGMTELLSQAYSTGNEAFRMHSSLQVSISEINDPFAKEKPGKSGILNITDLANLDSCCFIQTEDIARVTSENEFEVIGRMDIAELRGCNLLLEEVV